MGYIKQLKNKDLVGGTTNDDIYPITATSAVYDLDGRNLDLILKSITSGQLGGTSSGTSTTPDKIENIIIFGPGVLNPTTTWINDVRNTYGIPRGWTLTSNVVLLEDQYVYMAVGKKINNNFVTVEDSYYWSYPIRVTGKAGDSSTSATGADGEGINIIYYRTNTKVLSEAAIRPSFNKDDIEAITDKRYGLKEDGLLILSTIAPAWRDHPLGVSEEYRFEYVAISTSRWNAVTKETEWLSYTIPVLWSSFGEAGTDGDGVEYIFCLSSTYLDDPSSIINKNKKGYYSKADTPEYDDFIPDNPTTADLLYLWKDDPLEVSEGDPYLYVSIRKRSWDSNDKASSWGEFSTPTLWSRYGRDGISTEYTLLCDNDTVILDDNPNSNVANLLDAHFTLMKNGEPVPEEIRILRVDHASIKPDVINGASWTASMNGGDLYYNIINGNVPFLQGAYYTLIEALVEDTNGTITVQGKKYTKVASKKLTILIKDFSAGESYKLIVSPQVLKVDLNNVITSSPYWNIKAQKIDGEGVTFIEVDDVNLKLEFLTPNGTKLSGMPTIGQAIDSDYIVVNLSLKQGASWIRVDSETIGIVKDGKNGEGIYNVELDNTTIILDDTLMASSISAYNATLEQVSKTHCILYKGDQLMDDWKIVKSSSSILPPSFDINIAGEYIKLIYTGNDISATLELASKLAIGHYKIVLDFVLDSNPINIYTTKVINFNIEDITPDGTVYRLNIANSLRVFSDAGDKITTSSPIITVTSISNGQPKLESFVVVGKSSSATTSTMSNFVVKCLDTMNSITNPVTSESIPSPPYNANGYRYELYYLGKLVDSESIVCIKNGAPGDGVPGASGRSEYLTCDVASVYYDEATNTYIPPTITVSYMITKDKGINGNSGLFETVCDATKVISFGISDGSGGTNLGTALSGNPFILNFQEPRLNDYIEALCENLRLKIPIVFSAELGIEGCIIRLSKFTNDFNIIYRNDSELSKPRPGEAARYIDVIWDGEIWDNSVKIYMTLKEWSPKDWDIEDALNLEYIKEILASDPSYIPLLITDNLVFKTGQGNNLYLMNSQGNIVGGMMSTDSDTGDPVRIFAGTNISTNSPGQGDVNAAKFRVTLSGKLFASDAIILGTGQFTGVINAGSGIFKGDIRASSFEANSGSPLSIKITDNQFLFIGLDSSGTLRPLAYFKYGIEAEVSSTPTVLLYIWDNTVNLYRVIKLNDMALSSQGSSTSISVLPYTSGSTNINLIYESLSSWALIYKNTINNTTTYTLGSSTGPAASGTYLEISLCSAFVPIYNNAGSTTLYSTGYYFFTTVYLVLKVTYTGSTRTVNGTCYISKNVYWNNGLTYNTEGTDWRIYTLTSAPSSATGKRVYKDYTSYSTLNSNAKVLPTLSIIGSKYTGQLTFLNSIFSNYTYSAGQGPFW